jgi:hypothetical protein
MINGAMRSQLSSQLDYRSIQLLGCLTALTVVFLVGRSSEAAQKQEVILVDRPTIVAFFPPVTDTELDKDADTNEALSDFQLYARQARKRLEAVGIQFHEIYARSFIVQVHGKKIVFRSKDIEVGYYFVAPDRAPRIQYGVMTDDDIWAVATAYFHLPTKR